MTAPQQKKLKVRGPVVITGNRLADGAVVYRTANRRWSTLLQDAAVTTEANSATAFLNEASSNDIEAVGVYVAPVVIEGGDIKPGNLRERIRVGGPTIDRASSEAA